jgi:glutamate dehydrogenase/leucine dehydrogenase
MLTWAENRYKQSMERRSRKGKVAQIMGNKIIRIFDSQREIVRELGISQGNLSAALNEKRNYCNSYKWKYIDNPELLES